MNHVMCVKWGTLYGPEFVNNLYAMCKRNLTKPFQFHCITNNSDGIHRDINILPNQDKQLKGWWQKIIYFKRPLYDIEGPVLTLDLDMIIVDNIDCFFDFKIKDFCMKPDRAGHGFSSCTMRFEASQYPHIYDNLDIDKIEHAIDNSDRENFKKKKFWGDQIWITYQMRRDPLRRKVQTWPKNWIVLFGNRTHKDPKTKKQFIIPPGCKMIAWAGYKNDQRRVLPKIRQFWHSRNLTKNYR